MYPEVEINQNKISKDVIAFFFFFNDDQQNNFFDPNKIRHVWNESDKQWYISIFDVIGALTDSADFTSIRKKAP